MSDSSPNSAAPNADANVPAPAPAPVPAVPAPNQQGDVRNADIPEITNFVLNQTEVIEGATITTQQGSSAAGDAVTHVVFDSNNAAEHDPDIDLDMGQVITQYYDNTQNTETSTVLNEIRSYAEKIQCNSFQGKGTIDDYNQLFVAASKIANETKHMQLNVDIEGFNEFAAAADDLSALFQGFIVKLQKVNIIDDLNFLKAVSSALKKIANLADTFGKFKETILATATVELPKSAHDTKVVMEGVMSNINCAMTFVNHFINPDQAAPASADLSAAEKNIINKAVSTIDNWSLLCEQDVSVSMSNNPDIVYMKQASADLASKASSLRNNVNTLRAKLSVYKNI